MSIRFIARLWVITFSLVHTSVVFGDESIRAAQSLDQFSDKWIKVRPSEKNDVSLGYGWVLSRREGKFWVYNENLHGVCAGTKLANESQYFKALDQQRLAIRSTRENYIVHSYTKEKQCYENEIIEHALGKYEIYKDKNGRIPKAQRALINLALADINKEINFESPSLIAGITETPVSYVIDAEGRIDESTTANYFQLNPIAIYPVEADYDVYAAVSFGLRLYQFDQNGRLARELFGDYNTAFYSVAIDSSGNFLAASVPGLKRIYLYDLRRNALLKTIRGYAVTRLRFHKRSLYFAGYRKNKDWMRAALYRLSLKNGRIQRLTPSLFADVRGLAFGENQLFFSDGANHRIAVLDNKTFKLKTYWLGFNYPNGLSITPRNTLLVADEHAGVVRELDIITGAELRTVGYRVLRSPAHAEEIGFGQHEGKWLIADGDNNRLCLLDIRSSEILAEIGNIRSVMDFAVVPFSKQQNE